ncbi:MAG: hypothetical protein WCC31_00305, partial [Terracidiphilus sp.]
MSDGTILKASERMGYKGEMTGHGFRGVASAICSTENRLFFMAKSFRPRVYRHIRAGSAGSRFFRVLGAR